MSVEKTILVINSGSSSLKFSLFDSETHEVITSGIAEELNTDRASFTIKANDSKETDKLDGNKHVDAIKRLFDELDERGLKKTVVAVGHRVVNGTDEFTEPTLVTEQVIDDIDKLKPFAPLHNPAAAAGMRAVMEVMPDLPQVAVFDTAFHKTLPARAYRYAVPDSWYEKYGVRRYGFHGTSYKYVSHRAAKLLNLDIKDSAFVIAHIGGGASVAAVLNGESVDTSMGFTPLEGLVMGTRAGDIDTAIVPYMMKKLDKSADEILDILNHKSGLLGLSGLSNDQRVLEKAAKEGDKNAALALDTAAYSIAKYIAGMMVALPRKPDAIIFTAGAGENGSEFRALVAEHLKAFGCEIDVDQNNYVKGYKGLDGVISTKESNIKMMAIRTNEELMIAEETESLVSQLDNKK